MLESDHWILAACFGLLLLAVPPSNALAQENGPPHLNRAQSVINAFQVICQLKLPNLTFEGVEEHAAALRMPLQENTSNPSADNTITRRKAWIGGLKDGPFVLFLDEMAGTKAKVTSCAVVADVPDRNDFRAELVRTLKLPTAPAPEIGADHSHSYYWDGALGAHTTIIDRDFGSEKPGVMLKLVLGVGPNS